MLPELDLDAYLHRIGYSGPRNTTLETLAAIHRAHVGAIAFENLDPWLGRPVALDIGAVQRKLVAQRRGGFCFEQNLLLGRALAALGFGVAELAARVRWNVPAEVTRPRTHMLLAVNVSAQRYVVDAGFGGHTITAPLRLDRRVPQRTPHGHVRLLRSDGLYALQAEIGGAWCALYEFDLQPQQPADFAMACWYLCHHPDSIFRTTLMAARPLAEGRIALRDHHFTTYHTDGRAETRTLAGAAELRAVLQQQFGLDLGTLQSADGGRQLTERLEHLAVGPSA